LEKARQGGFPNTNHALDSNIHGQIQVLSVLDVLGHKNTQEGVRAQLLGGKHYFTPISGVFV
jgi:hypothetical protein